MQLMNTTDKQTKEKQGASPLMSCQEGASYLRLSQSAFWNKCRNGEIPHIRLSSRCYRVRKADLDAFINSRTR
jgi:excisionase family DNA binding protein